MELNIRNHYRKSFQRGLIWSALIWGFSVAVAGYSSDSKDLSEAERRSRIHELYQRQIPLLEQYVRNHPNSERSAQSLFRLGEAYFESAKYYQVQENNSRVALFFQRAIETLEKLRTDYPTYERADEALFVLSSAYLETSRNVEAGGILAEISRRFPESKVMDQAAYLLGDHFYAENDMAQAKRYYEMATRIEKSEVYGHYRLAWVALRSGQAAVSLRHFEETIELSLNRPGQGFDYSKDAAREMVWPALEVHRPQQVLAYLQKSLPNQDLLLTALDHLAAGALTKGDYRLASQIYDYLTQKFSSSEKMQHWIGSQLEAEEKLGRSDRIVDLVSRLSESQGNSLEVRTQIYTSAKKYHALAQAEKDPKIRDSNYDQAIAYYQAFVRMGEDPKTQETAFYLGEALFTRGRFEEALLAYRSSAQGEHEKRIDATWNWYHTAEKLAPGFKHEGSSVRATSKEDEEFLEAARFVSSAEFMRAEQRLTASYQSARLLYQLNQLDRALPIFEDLAERFTHSKEGRLSAQLVLDIYNLKGDFRSVAKYAREFQSTAQGPEQSRLAGLESQALFKTLQAEEKKVRELPEPQKIGGLNQMAQRYLQFSRQYTESELSAAAAWAALQLSATVATHQADRRFERVRESFDLLMSRHAKSEYSPQAVSLMGEFLAYQKPEAQSLVGMESYREAWLKQMRSKPAAERGLWGEYLWHISSESQRKDLLAEFVKLPVSAENRGLISKSKFQEVEKHLANYRGVSLDSLKTLAANTQKKLKLLETLEGAVKGMVELGEPVPAVNSLNFLAVAYAEMGKAFREAPVPDNLEPEQLSQYRAAVEGKAREYDEEARTTRDLALQTAKRLGLKGGS
jgi:TolA-binding protein